MLTSTIRRYVLTGALLLGLCSLGRAQITRMEYFIDQEPGFGKATAVPVTPGGDVAPSFTVPLATVSLGFHALYVRTRDAQGRWSLTYKHTFYNTVLSPSNQALTAAEYFIDQEPGTGRGTPIPLPAGQTDATLAFTVDLRNVTAGPHTLFMRVADKTRAWSQATRHAFFVKPGGAATITALRYNFTRPGFTSSLLEYKVPTPAPVVSLDFNPDISQLTATGTYDMNIYAVSSDGQQSLVYTVKVTFTVLSAHNPLALDGVFRNTPNPFTRGTLIEFELDTPQRVTLILRDLHGREVATLAKDKVFGKGSQKVLYENNALAAGLYFCEIRSGGFNRTIKLLKQ